MAKVTIDDIAQKAGVSKTSVSFAFNNPDRLSEATLSRILSVAEELGYSPDPLASNLKTRRTGCIGILVPQTIPLVARNPHMFEFIEGIGQTCHETGYSLMMVPPLKGSVRRAIVRAAVDGFVTLGLEPYGKTMTVLFQRGVPFVMSDSEPVDKISCVNVDNALGAETAMRYVLERGHRRIVLLGMLSPHGGRYQRYTGTLKQRIEGYLRALEAYDLSIDDQHVRLIECQVDADTGAQTFETLWKESDPKPTAIVAMADILALGAMRSARRMGLRIPDDISFIGYDGIASDQFIDPPLTTIRQPTLKKGEMAARFLIDLVNNKHYEPRHVELPVQLLEGASVRDLRVYDLRA